MIRPYVPDLRKTTASSWVHPTADVSSVRYPGQQCKSVSSSHRNQCMLRTELERQVEILFSQLLRDHCCSSVIKCLLCRCCQCMYRVEQNWTPPTTLWQGSMPCHATMTREWHFVYTSFLPLSSIVSSVLNEAPKMLKHLGNRDI